jgi:glycosyltransferase involved in cell wall biosynthesis
MSASMIMDWYKKAALSLLDENKTDRCSQTINSPLVHNSSNEPPILTIITSLYKGEKYIKTFLENITSQTIFNQCCLFIINANSPESEELFIAEYLERYPHNIVYKKLDITVGIYEAWNFAIDNSISEFITNANLDDLHRKDAMELKVQALQNNSQIDVVYSDIYYSFLENLPFEIVEKCGLRTNLPVANKFNLLQFNSPHNSPMWRRSLHQKIGYFDTIYKSAGDYEFWLRAAFSGSLFMKIPHEVLVSYYHNPKGLSTRASNSNQGVSEHDPAMEGAKVHRIYRSLVDTIEG